MRRPVARRRVHARASTCSHDGLRILPLEDHRSTQKELRHGHPKPERRQHPADLAHAGGSHDAADADTDTTINEIELQPDTEA
jgi:hypothetical protein